MDELYDPNTFEMDFPFWTLLHPTKLSQRCIQLGGVNKEVATPLFTDKDLAERFQKDTPQLAHYALGCIEDRAKLLPFLDILEKNGFTHVTFDHTKRGAMFFPISQIRNAA